MEYRPYRIKYDNIKNSDFFVDKNNASIRVDTYRENSCDPLIEIGSTYG